MAQYKVILYFTTNYQLIPICIANNYYRLSSIKTHACGEKYLLLFMNLDQIAETRKNRPVKQK